MIVIVQAPSQAYSDNDVRDLYQNLLNQLVDLSVKLPNTTIPCVIVVPYGWVVNTVQESSIPQEKVFIEEVK